MQYQIAKDVKEKVDQLINQLKMDYIDEKRIYCIRSFDAKTRAIARIWGMSRLFAEVCGIKPCYIIEVNNKRFDKLSERDKIKTLIHELLHIPKTFSGALLSHRGRYHRINDKAIENILKKAKI
jgi:Predicted metallopeptidase